MSGELETTYVTTVFLRNDADVLLVRRSEAVGSYSGAWGGVAGHVEDRSRQPRAGRTHGPVAHERDWSASEAAARAEIEEETGLDAEADVALVRSGDPFEVVDEQLATRWVVHPFLFDVATREVELNEEAAGYEWAPPTEILRRETVPDLWTSYDRVRPTAATVADDRDHGAATLSIRALEVLRDEAAVAVERDAAVDLAATARALCGARPSMPVVANRVNRVMDAAGDATPAAVEAAAGDELERALAADDRAAARAVEHLPDHVATLSLSGTVATAFEERDPESVLVAESRPGREGVETAERLVDATTADVVLTTDSALADGMAERGVEALVVGADAVLPDGRVINKVGTRGAATAAAHDGVDCYVVTASDKVASDHGVERSERDPAELYEGDADVTVSNPTFDVTPADAITAVVTETGVLDDEGVRELAEAHRERADWEY